MGTRLLQRKARRLVEEMHRSELAAVDRPTKTVWRMNLGDANTKCLVVSSQTYEGRRIHRGRLPTTDPKLLLAAPVPHANVDMVPAPFRQPVPSDIQLTAQTGAAALVPQTCVKTVSLGDGNVLPQVEVVRRLRRMPLARLDTALLELRELNIDDRDVWEALASRVAANACALTPESLSWSLRALTRYGLLDPVRLAEVTSALALQVLAPAEEGSFMPSRSLLLLCHSCSFVLDAAPNALWGNSLVRALSERLPMDLARASASETLPWAQLFSDRFLVDEPHMAVWQQIAASLEGDLSAAEARTARALEAQLPLWIAELMPRIPELEENGGIQGVELEESEKLRGVDAVVLSPDVAISLDKGSAARVSQHSTLRPAYQTSPLVPVLWHTSSDTCRRALSKLNTKQLILSLQYAAADHAGLARTAAPPVTSHGEWPRWHRNRTKARTFVANLLEAISRKADTLGPPNACSAICSLGSFYSAGLVPTDAAGVALEELLQGLSGIRVVTRMSPRHLALLLMGLSKLSEGPAAPLAASVDAKTLSRLVNLAACMLQEASVPIPVLQSLCAATVQLSRSVEADAETMPELRRSLFTFVGVAARRAVRGDAEARRLLTVLRATSELRLWSSNVFPILAHTTATTVKNAPDALVQEILGVYVRTSRQCDPSLAMALFQRICHGQDLTTEELVALSMGACRILRRDEPMRSAACAWTKTSGRGGTTLRFDSSALAEQDELNRFLDRWRQLTVSLRGRGGVRRRGSSQVSDSSVVVACAAFSALTASPERVRSVQRRLMAATILGPDRRNIRAYLRNRRCQ